MSVNLLEVNNLKKSYLDFELDNISFSIPRGTIVGLIGQNGAGKSTTLNIIHNLVKKDSGNVIVFGEILENLTNLAKNQIGVVFDGGNLPDTLTVNQLNTIFKNIYDGWDEKYFFKCVGQFSLSKKKPISEFSKGMKMKTSIAIALSHHPKLLILDEATSGLDPIVREEVLDIFHSFVKNKENSILLSSHISSDLEKIADYLVFIHKGNMVFTESKEKLVQNYGVLRTNKNPFDEIDQTDIFSFRKNKDSWEVLINNKEQFTEKYPSENLQNASIDDILTLYIKGEQL